MKNFTPSYGRIVVSPGKSRVFSFLLAALLPLLFAACPSPTESDPASSSGYPVTFDWNDESGNKYVGYLVYPATTLTDFPENPSPSQAGFVFAGWYANRDGTGTPFDPSSVVKNSTIYAKWTPIPENSYTVVFMSNYDPPVSLAAKIVASSASTIGAANFPANPSRSGYIFSGWHTDPGGSGTPFTASTPVEGDMTVYASWTEAPSGSYAVTFMLNDGTQAIHAVKIVTWGETIGADFPEAPSRAGYSFARWNNTSSGYGSNFTESSPVYYALTVYAQWTPNAYTVTFMINDGAGTVHDTKFVTVPATTIGTANWPTTPTRSGYTFANRWTDDTGSEFTSSTTVNNDMTVWAQWTALSYTITYNNLNGADNTANPAAYTAENLPLILVAPADRASYDFDGWYNNQYFTGDPVDTIPEGSTGGKTFYARWTGEVSRVTFMRNDGTETVYETKTVTFPSTTIGVSNWPSTPTRSGYIFDNRWTDGTGSEFTSSTSVTGDITVWAQWTISAYNISYAVSDGGNNAVNPESYTVESPDIALAAPTRTGYAFDGWYNNQYFTGDPVNTIPAGSTGDKTFHGRWTRDITLNLGDAGDGAFSEGNFSIYKSGVPDSQTIAITGTGYTNPLWYVDGILKETDEIITISAADYSLGGHNLTLIITKSGVSWSKEISFTVNNY